MRHSDMEQRKRNIRLLGVLSVLAAVSLALHFVPRDKQSSLKNVDTFQLADTATVDKIVMRSKTFDNTLMKYNNHWKINDRYEADPSIMQVLLTVMTRIEITRPIPKNQEEEMEKRFAEGGIEVEFFAGDEKVHSFMAGSNSTKTISIFKSDDGGYFVVNFPGYDSFVTGIFEITETDWRDRLLLSATPGNLQEMTVSYPQNDEQGFTVTVEGNFPVIRDIAAELDTLKLMEYLDQFQYFQADNFVERGSNEKYDSLAGTTPYAIFTFKNLIGREDRRLVFFPRIPGDPYIMGFMDTGDTVAFSHRRIVGIFRGKDDFAK